MTDKEMDKVYYEYMFQRQEQQIKELKEVICKIKPFVAEFLFKKDEDNPGDPIVDIDDRIKIFNDLKCWSYSIDLDQDIFYVNRIKNIFGYNKCPKWFTDKYRC